MAKPRKKSFRICPKCGEQSVRWHITARRYICEAGCGHIARWELREAGQTTCGFSIVEKCQCGTELDKNGNCPNDQQLVEGL